MGKQTVEREKLRKLLAAGDRLSNIAFNLSQHHGEPLKPRDCASMKAAQVEWDEALRAITKTGGG